MNSKPIVLSINSLVDNPYYALIINSFEFNVTLITNLFDFLIRKLFLSMLGSIMKYMSSLVFIFEKFNSYSQQKNIFLLKTDYTTGL